MNPIIALLKESNISDEKIKETFQVLTDNPIMMMPAITALGLPPEKLQSVMMTAMQDPSVIVDAVEELGLDYSKVESAKEVLNK